MMSRPLAIATVIAVVVATCAVGYIYLNRTNPFLWEIIIGSVAISLVLGGVSALVQHLWEKGITGTLAVLAMVVVAFLALLIAALVWVSNAPKSIKKEIPVTYLVSPRKKELAAGLFFPDTTATICYMDAERIFKNFRDKCPDNAKRIEDLAKDPGQTQDVESAIEFFQNFTEYLVACYIGKHFTTPETEETIYRKETGKWLGFPHQDIADKRRSFEPVADEIKGNLFYATKGHFAMERFELRLPKNTEITLEKGEPFSSRIVLKNKFVEITIGVFCGIRGSQSLWFLDDSAFLHSSDYTEELKLAFRGYKTIVYYDVAFSKWRYAYPEMKYYEEWANDMFAMLQRKFAWGSPALADEVEVFRRLEQATKKSKE